MPRIFQKAGLVVAALAVHPFTNESELEAAIVETPDLVAEVDARPMAYVARQVRLENAGILDILLVDSDGTPAAVEVKLGRNAESRREVVGQVVDYVSVLTSMTVDELDRSVGGALEQALRSLTATADDPDSDFERLWSAVGTNLRAGSARYVIAIDEPSTDLLRIVRFLAARSSLRVSLVSIRRYLAPNGEALLVPEVSAHVDPGETISRSATRPPVSAELQAVLEAYAAVASPGFLAVGQSARYRQIRPTAWPAGLHYEFLRRRDGIGVELHFESKMAQRAIEAGARFAGPPRPEFPHRLEWDPAWTYGPRLFASFPAGADGDTVARAMKQFIDLTFSKVAATFKQSA